MAWSIVDEEKFAYVQGGSESPTRKTFREHVGDALVISVLVVGNIICDYCWH